MYLKTVFLGHKPWISSPKVERNEKKWQLKNYIYSTLENVEKVSSLNGIVDGNRKRPKALNISFVENHILFLQLF